MQLAYAGTQDAAKERVAKKKNFLRACMYLESDTGNMNRKLSKKITQNWSKTKARKNWKLAFFLVVDDVSQDLWNLSEAKFRCAFTMQKNMDRTSGEKKIAIDAIKAIAKETFSHTYANVHTYHNDSWANKAICISNPQKNYRECRCIICIIQIQIMDACSITTRAHTHSIYTATLHRHTCPDVSREKKIPQTWQTLKLMIISRYVIILTDRTFRIFHANRVGKCTNAKRKTKNKEKCETAKRPKPYGKYENGWRTANGQKCARYTANTTEEVERAGKCRAE